MLNCGKIFHKKRRFSMYLTESSVFCENDLKPLSVMGFQNSTVL